MFYNNYKWSITFKNCESLYCIPVIYITLYIHYTSIKKKKGFRLNYERHGASRYNEPESPFLGSRWGLGSYLPGLGYNLRQRYQKRKGKERKWGEENGCLRLCRHNNTVCKDNKERMEGTSLGIQWLRLCTPSAGGLSSIPGRGTKILYAAWHGQKREKIDMQERSL